MLVPAQEHYDGHTASTRGVPEHAWELETAEHLLDEWCWVRALAPDTLDRRDYSAFRLSAWCSSPGLIPPATDLVLVEPPTPVEEDLPMKRALSYTVKITVLLGDGRSLGGKAPPPTDSNRGTRHRWRDSWSQGSSAGSSEGWTSSREAAPRVLDPGASVPTDASSGVQERRAGVPGGEDLMMAVDTVSSHDVAPTAEACIDVLAAAAPFTADMGDMALVFRLWLGPSWRTPLVAMS